jgi:hypothetical protein
MFRKPSLIWMLALVSTALLTSMAVSGQTQEQKAPKAIKASLVAEIAPGLSGIRYESGNRPDPFLNPISLRRNVIDPDAEMPRGTPPPGIAGMSAKEVELLGMSMSPEGKTAVFQGTDKRVYFLREGDRLFDGYLKSIALDSVLLIRETKLKSGKVLIQEITKRLRTE